LRRILRQARAATDGTGDAAKATAPIGIGALLMASPVVIPNQKSTPHLVRDAASSFMAVDESRQTPADHRRFKRAAGFVVAPLAVEIVAGER
jgi:hypothetical protein